MRVFVGLSLESLLQQQLHRWSVEQRLGELGWRILRPESLHVTLEFIGERDDGEVSRLTRAVGRAARSCAPFRLLLEGWGVFPSHGRPRVLWAGITQGVEDVARLARRVRSETRQPGSSDADAFTPHVTLGRARRGSPPRRPGEGAPQPTFGWQSVCAVTLFRSILGPAGARYEALSVSPLGGEHE